MPLNPNEKRASAILQKLLSAKDLDLDNRRVILRENLTEDDLFFLTEKSEKLFMAEPTLLELASPLKIVGDVHGQFEDVLRMFKSQGFPPEHNYLFLGDYVDRGVQSIETISILLALKIRYPNNFFLIRGNHESSSISRYYGFKKECCERFDVRVWRTFVECFNCLPICALIERKIFCTHGGLSPYLNSFSDILKIRRPIQVPNDGLLCDLLWSDPAENISGWRRNTRGTSFFFGKDVIDEQVRKLGIEMVVRAHQMVNRGVDFLDRKFVTVFSAPNYTGNSKNWGAVMNIDENLRINFILLLSRDL